MFKRIELEAWHEVLPFIGFFLTFAVFLVVLVRALRLHRDWWLWTFYIFVIFFIFYWVFYYQFGLFSTDEERLEDQVARIEATKAEKLEALMGDLDDVALWKMSRNAKIVAEGKETYSAICSSCHAPDLGGSKSGPQFIGLPLNDAEWKHGSKPMEIFKVVMDGSPDKTKGMAPWNKVLGGNKVAKVTAFVLSAHEVPEGVDTAP
jgi:cytochrome c oxidase cbb3-type subunit 3